MKIKAFDFAGALYFVPLALFHVAVFWFPSVWFTTIWGVTAYWAIAALLLLPWLKARIYPNESLGKIVLLETVGVVTIALLFFLRGIGGRTVDAIILVIGAIALVRFALHERRKNQIAARDHPPV